MLRCLLEAEGLFAVVSFDQQVTMNYSHAWAIGGVIVQVIDAEFAQALEITRRCRAGEFQTLVEAEVGPSDLPVCPRCGSAQYQTRRYSSYLMAVLGILWPVVMPVREHSHRCDHCHKRWVD